MSQLNLPRGTDNIKKCKIEKITKKYKTDMLKSNSKSQGNHAVVLKKKKEKERL